MFVKEAGRVFMGFILYISGVQGQENSICALKGSSVDLPCSYQHPTSNMKWYTVQRDGSTPVLNELAADGNRVMSKTKNFTLTINDLTESDANAYCCKENNDKQGNCWPKTVQVQVADMQVKVIPATEGQTVTLMCSTSCPLTENPAAYIWYKNREFLYQDWSPWYQHLVSSEKAVTYSCAIKGYEHLRAPEVSVDSITSTCFSVTYAKGRMCSNKEISVEEPCSITYPREVHVQKSPVPKKDHFRLTCDTSCALTDPQTALWSKHNDKDRQEEKPQFVVPTTSVDSFSCAVKGFEDLHSPEVCSEDRNCWSVNYVSRRICALRGSSVNISSEYSHPNHQQPKNKVWYKIKSRGQKDAEELTEATGRLEYHDNMKNQHNLRITNLKKNDSAEYMFRLQANDKGWKRSDSSGVTLVVTGVKVVFTPSAVVTEGQRVTLTCSTSCPLTDNTNYIWFLNSRLLTQTENQNKQLVLDPVSSQHAGNYSCAVQSPKNIIRSPGKTLTVQTITRRWIPATAAGVCAALLVLIPLAVLLWTRKKTSSSQPSRTETYHNKEQHDPGPVYEEMSAQPTEKNDLHYSRVLFPENDPDHPLYTTVQPHQNQEQEYEPYSVINCIPNMMPEHGGQAVNL